MKATVFAATLLSSAQAWWGTGHLMTARIAYERLIELGREDIIDLVEDELAVISQFVHLEKNHPFVECATFADWIKNSGWGDLTTWHFVDTPLFDEGYSTEVHLDSENVVWAIQQMRDQILDPVGYEWWPAEQPSPLVDPSLSRSFNFRLLIHYFGDIH